MKTTLYPLLVVLLFWLSSCGHHHGKCQSKDGITRNEYGVPQYKEVQQAGIQMITVDGKYKVWTKKVGHGDIKVLLLHGGPGVGHEYLEAFESFLPQANIQMYYYAQLGNFNSDQPDDTTLWNIPRYVEEVEQVRKGLGLDSFYLVGHSWGGILGMEYSFKYQQHLKGFVISNMTASIPDYVRYITSLKHKLSAPVVAKLDSYEKAGTYAKSDEYQKIVHDSLYCRYICRLNPWPDPVERTFKHYNPQVYNTMQGDNEFIVTGNFKDWTAWDRLPSLQIPTLVIGAKYDEMDPEDIKKMGKLIPNSRVLMCENGSHMCMYDDQQTYFNGVIKFLKEVQKGTFKADAK